MRYGLRAITCLALLILALLGSPAFAGCLTTPAASNLITSDYGWRFHPVYHRWRLHRGADFRAQLSSNGQGQPLVAAEAGTVQVASSASGGNELRIVNSDGVMVRYLHLTKALVKPGTQVSAGQVVAESGGTGEASAAPHLHFEVYVQKHDVNPESMLCTAAQHKAGADSSDGFPVLQCDPLAGQQCPGSTSVAGGGSTGNGGTSGGTEGGSAPVPAVPVDTDPPPAPETAAWDDMSTIELITTEIYKRFGNPDWYRQTAERSSVPLLQDYMQMMALDNYLTMRRQRSVERTDQLWSVKSSRDAEREMQGRLRKQRDVVNRSP